MSPASRLIAVFVAALIAAAGGSVHALPALAAQWGSSYGDPPGFCPEQSFLPGSYTVLTTNDPLVGTNPEQNTFWGLHPNPGYDDWYGRWYGDFRGGSGDDSGWLKLFTGVPYPSSRHWNFSDFGWAVHGHAKQYIAYYNWTFGGSCGLGVYGAPEPGPYMADVYGNPVVDIYVDSTPPWPPAPVVAAVTATSVSFTWAPVADRGDGAGADYFAVGVDRYRSWLTVGNGPVQQYAETADPVVVTATGLTAGQSACVHVVAVDKLNNATPASFACGQAFLPPPLIGAGAPPWLSVPAPPPAPAPAPAPRIGVPFLGPPAGVPAPAVAPVVAPAVPPVAAPTPPPPSAPQSYPEVKLDGLIGANPTPGLAGLESWFWLAPAPAAQTRLYLGYTITLVPQSVLWDFGDGGSETDYGAGAFGQPYPIRSSIRHTYQAQSQAGFPVTATVSYATTWSALTAGGQTAPAPGPPLTASTSINYPVRQAQPELT